MKALRWTGMVVMKLGLGRTSDDEDIEYSDLGGTSGDDEDRGNEHIFFHEAEKVRG